MQMRDAERWVRVEEGMARGLMFAMAATLGYVGATLLTTPLAVPLTVGLWLGAASLAGLGVFHKLPHDM